jgi:hypothetical protein
LTERNFKVIRGGAVASIRNNTRTFKSAFVTDTRLMGVVGLYISWELSNKNYKSDFHQFFYFDAEEYGFETYKGLIGDDEVALNVIEQTLIGGLGGSKVNVTEKEATYLVQKYTAMNKDLSIPMPEPLNEYSFLLGEPVLLSDKEQNVLMDKICTPILSEYQLINYFMMRVFGRDFEGAAHLSKNGLDLESLAGSTCATLCKNSIEEFPGEQGISYLCESLIDLDGKYELVVSEVYVDHLKVARAEKRSSFSISSVEAAMMLNRSEFVTVYEIISDPELFLANFAEVSSSSMQTIHDNGRLYLEFNKNNDHVNRKIFRLNEDIHGLYYVTEFGQLITAAYSLVDIHSIERKLRNSKLDKCLIATAKYEFKEPILYEFIQSDFEDFSDFLDYLNT